MLAVSKRHISEGPSYLPITQTKMGQDRTRGMKETNLDQVEGIKFSENGPFILERYFYSTPEAERVISTYIGMDLFVHTDTDHFLKISLH